MFPSYYGLNGKLKNTENLKFESKYEDNPYIVETAGFVPLDVKFKQLEQGGIQAQFNQQDFTVQDWRNIYFGEDTEIYMTDEIEDVERKLRLQKAKYDEIKNRLASSTNGTLNEKQNVQEPILNTNSVEKLQEKAE